MHLPSPSGGLVYFWTLFLNGGGAETMLSCTTGLWTSLGNALGNATRLVVLLGWGMTKGLLLERIFKTLHVSCIKSGGL
jgi:hypothetical protein